VDSQTFSNIDAAKWQRIQASVKSKASIDITTDTGIASAKGVTISWTYTLAIENLLISLVKRSFYDPSQATIDTDIAQWISAA
jgi:hypothetical protein